MLAQFEGPLPELSVDLDEIAAEAHGVYEGSFFIRNAGGGKLSGRITSHSPCAVFAPESFEAPKRVNFRVSTEGFRVGEVIRTGAVIMSNGGEKYIPIAITAAAAAIETGEGVLVTNMRTFLEYARMFPASAAHLMGAPQFKEMLERTGFEFIGAYAHILTDTNRPRALECLLRLSGLKKAAKTTVLQKYTEVRLGPFQKEIYFGRIPIQMEGWGHLDEKINVKNGSHWLKPLNTLSQAVEESGMLGFSVDPNAMRGRYASDTLVLPGGPGAEAVVTAIRQPYFQARTNKESYSPGETGAIYVTNNTGMNLMLEIQPSETFILFEAKGHFIGEYAEIPFQSRLSAFHSMTVKRQPIEAVVSIRAKVRDELIRKQLKIRIGDFL